MRNRSVDPRALVELLWLDDALELLERRGAVRGAHGKPRDFVWDRVCERFDVTKIGTSVRERLKARAVTPRWMPRMRVGEKGEAVRAMGCRPPGREDTRRASR